MLLNEIVIGKIRLVLTPIYYIRMYSFYLPLPFSPFSQEGMEILKLFGGIIITNSLYLTKIQLGQPVPSIILVELTEPLPF